MAFSSFPAADAASQPPARPPVEAFVFDMDGVLTQTAEVHAGAWKRLFDTFFAHWNEQHPGQSKAYDAAHDYLAYIDGRPRFEAIQFYLRHQGIELPQGSINDAPGFATVGELGNLKNAYFLEIIENEGVALYASTLDLIHDLRSLGIKVALVTSSRNAEVVLEKSGTSSLFEVIIDGRIAADLGLPGKPAPDTFLAACAQLSVEPSRAVLVEDAVSGVQAGARGGLWARGRAGPQRQRPGPPQARRRCRLQRLCRDKSY